MCTMEPTADEIEIARLEKKVEVIEGKRDQLKPTDTLYADRELAFTKEISLIRQERLLLMGQKGKFASPISAVLSHSYRSHIFAHSLSTSPLHPSSGGNDGR